MTDNLRDRIAAVIYDHQNPLSREQCEEIADAVIAALGLRYEPCYDDDSHRYVTEWEDR